MAPENLKFGGGSLSTNLHPLILVLMLLAVLMMLFLQRKYLIVPLLSMAFLVPLAQQIVVGSVHIFVIRIVVIAGLIRMILAKFSSQKQILTGGFDTVDKLFLTSNLYQTFAFFVLAGFTASTFANRIGVLWDFLGGYFLVRFLIQDREDIYRAIKTFAVLACILSLCMLNESLRMQNVFGLLGGFMIVPEMRDGLVRAQASFSHPLLAGCFGATLLPLFVLLWKSDKSRLLAMIGVFSSLAMIVFAASSTPILAFGAAIGAICLWPLREKMRLIRWGIVFALVGLHLVMKAPVWFLIGRIGVMGSSSGDHRAYLVDLFIRHFSDWWLIGTNDYLNWGWDMWDTSNEYVSQGENGGLLVFICFIAIIAVCFSRVARARKLFPQDKKEQWFYWLLGTAVFSHAVAFFGVSYFDNTKISWFVLLAIVTAATAPVLSPIKTPESSKEVEPLNGWRQSRLKKRKTQIRALNEIEIARR